MSPSDWLLCPALRSYSNRVSNGSLAERYRQDGDDDQCRKLIAEAVECHPGHEGLQQFEAHLKIDKPINWREILAEKTTANETQSMMNVCSGCAAPRHWDLG